MKIRLIMEQAQREWRQVTERNKRQDLVNMILAVDLLIATVLKLEAMPEVPQPCAIRHLRD